MKRLVGVSIHRGLFTLPLSLLLVTACEQPSSSAAEVGDADGDAGEPDDDDNDASPVGDGLVGGGSVAVTCNVPASHPTIQAAENDLSCTTVIVSAGTYFENVVIDRDLVIAASTPGAVTIDGGSLGRVIDNVGANVVLQGLTITHGAALTGAGVRSTGSLEMYDSVVVTNRAQGVDALGAGVHATGDVLLDETVLFDNTVLATVGSTVVGGGGIYINGGDLVVTNYGTISNNVVTVDGLASCDARGGGIYAIDAAVFVEDQSAVHKNIAWVRSAPSPLPQAAEGGGVHIRGDNSSFSLVDSRIASNIAQIDRGRAAGGGLFSWGTALEIGAGSAVRANIARVNLPGLSSALGGAIMHGFSSTPGEQDPFVVDQAAIHGNSALSGSNSAGGAIYTYASNGDALVSVLDSAVYDNRSIGGTDGRSGAIEAQATCCNNQSMTLEIRNSTLSGNTSGGATASAGALFVFAAAASEAHLIVVNSTISGNTATALSSAQVRGGAIVLGSEASIQTTTLEIASSTIVDNAATGPFGSGGGGIWASRQGYSGPTSIDIRDTILRGNTATNGPDCATSLVTVTSGGYNLFGNTAGCTIAGATANDLVGVDPLLSPLAANGGPTLTRMIGAASPALDAGNPAGCTDIGGGPLAVDQRGAVRPVGPACDIGAVER